MHVYHVTTRDKADFIEAHGFRDGRGRYMTDSGLEGVFVSDQPLDANSGAVGDLAFEIDVPVALIAEYELIEEGKGYREWIVPASLLNSCPRRRLDDY
jgi:hypothetical protein